MRIPITKYGLPQVAVFPAILVAAMVVCFFVPMPAPALWVIQAILLIVLIWAFSFFRNPARKVPTDSDLLISPADGKITDVETVEKAPFIEGPALRIGIFLSIFNVHINRAPCNATVEKIVYKEGKFKNAMSPDSAKVNESNDLYMRRTDLPGDRLVVRQISGAIARRIVCATAEGQKLTAGEQFGMIKFGSRTELYVPVSENTICLAKIGDKVKAGLTPLVRYEKCQD